MIPKTHITSKWIFEDLMSGDKFKGIKGAVRGIYFKLIGIDYKRRYVTLAPLSASCSELTMAEEAFNECFNFIAWHN